MNEKLKGYWEKAKEQAGKVNRKMWIIAGIVLVVIAAAITIYLNTRPWTTLIVSTDQNELTAVLNWLDEQGYQEFRLEGDAIMVPNSQAISLKTRLLAAGYPQEGYSYSTYLDNINMMSTEAERNYISRLDLQEYLASIISGLNGIKSAQVVISPGEDNGYILDPGNVINATASVKVTTQNDELLSTETAASIRSFVAHAVQGLEVSEVAIMDQFGGSYPAELDSTGGTGTVADASALKLLLQSEYENRMRRDIMLLLSKLYGEENVQAVVHCDVDVNVSEVTDYQVHVPDGAVWTESGLGGIIGTRSYAYTVESEGGTTAGGTVGTTTNSDLPDDNFPSYVEQDPGFSDYPDIRSGSGQIDYDNSKTQTHTYLNSAEIVDCHVAVTINTTTAGAVDTESVREMVANAAGINAVVTEEMTAAEYLSTKVSIYPAPFYNPTTPSDGQGQVPGVEGILGIQPWILIAAAAGLVLFILILLMIMLLRGRKRKRIAAQQAEETQEIADIIAIVEPAPEEPQGADVMELQTERSMELRQDIRQFAEENPEVAAQLLKAWLRGGEDDG